jgi:hypothetical protein
MPNIMRILPIAAALLSAGWTVSVADPPGLPRPELVATHTFHGPGHGPPDVRQFYICRVLPRYGGGFCTSPPYAPVGKTCSCEGPHGPRPGAVEHR